MLSTAAKFECIQILIERTLTLKNWSVKGKSTELRELIELAEQETGGTAKLAHAIGVNANAVTCAKRHDRGLPVAACFQLAEIIGEDARTVIAASELVTEKKPERRAVLLPFVNNAARMSADAGVILLSTPAALKAAQLLDFAVTGFCIMSTWLARMASRKQTA